MMSLNCKRNDNKIKGLCNPPAEENKRTAKSLGTQASCLREAGWKPANPGAGKMPAFPGGALISIYFKQCSSLAGEK